MLHNIIFLSLVVLSTYTRIEKHIDDGIPKDVAETKIFSRIQISYFLNIHRIINSLQLADANLIQHFDHF